jgi:hypothetical protein
MTHAAGFKVKAWMGASDLAPLPLENEIWTAANRSKRLAELHEEIVRRNPPFGNTILEFVVPRSLLGEDFDQWQMVTEEMGYIGRLIDDFPVVVRSYERIRCEPAMAKLRRRWEQLRERLNDPCQLIEDIVAFTGTATERGLNPKAVWVADQRTGDRLYRVLNLEQTVLCALLDRAPKSKFTQNAMDVFKALLLCGIPLASRGIGQPGAVPRPFGPFLARACAPVPGGSFQVDLEALDVALG